MKAVQHLLSEVGYVGTKVGDKSEDPAAVAMEMTPDEVQWLKVLTIYVQFHIIRTLFLSLSLSLSGSFF